MPVQHKQLCIQLLPVAWLFQFHSQPHHLHCLQSRVQTSIQEASVWAEQQSVVSASAPAVNHSDGAHCTVKTDHRSKLGWTWLIIKKCIEKTSCLHSLASSASKPSLFTECVVNNLWTFCVKLHEPFSFCFLGGNHKFKSIQVYIKPLLRPLCKKCPEIIFETSTDVYCCFEHWFSGV